MTFVFWNVYCTCNLAALALDLDLSAICLLVRDVYLNNWCFFFLSLTNTFHILHFNQQKYMVE